MCLRTAEGLCVCRADNTWGLSVSRLLGEVEDRVGWGGVKGDISWKCVQWGTTDTV